MVDPHSPALPSPDGDPGSPPVTLCCATVDQSAVQAAAGSLAARGHRVELAIGVDADPSLLTRAIDVLGGRGLYVLCRSHTLDRAAIDHLRELLREREVPFGRTLTLAVDVQRPRELEQRVVSVLRRMVTGRADGKPKPWDSSVPPGDEDPDTTVRRPGVTAQTGSTSMLDGLGTIPEDADPHASTSQIEVFGGLDAQGYTGADHTQVTRVPTEPRPSPLPAPVPSRTAPPTTPTPVITTAPPTMPTAPQAVVPPPAQAGPQVPMMEGGSVPMVGATVETPADLLVHETPAALHATPEDSAVDFEPPLTLGGRVGRALGSPAGLAVVLGGLAVIGLVFGISAVVGDDDDDAGEVAKAGSVSADGADADANDDAASDEQTPKGEPAADDGAKKAEEPTEANTPLGAAGAEVEAVAAADDGTPTKEVPPAAEPQAAPEPVAAEPEPRAEAVADDVTRSRARTLSPDEDPPEVVEALKSRDVRALDVFLVAPERKGTLNFEAALEYCDALEVAGLSGWRAPAIGELHSIATAKMLGKAVFWSVTPGDTFGDLMLVLNSAKKNRISVVTAGWDGARIVCIRPRQPS
ncbi:MAG: hypothetical protein K0V04_07470 [Deltaproteobacteria bacterium]|nr:hypothetical protein [Deltaproteobacteria bacterium]